MIRHVIINYIDIKYEFTVFYNDPLGQVLDNSDTLIFVSLNRYSLSTLVDRIILETFI